MRITNQFWKIYSSYPGRKINSVNNFSSPNLFDAIISTFAMSGRLINQEMDIWKLGVTLKLRVSNNLV